MMHLLLDGGAAGPRRLSSAPRGRRPGVAAVLPSLLAVLLAAAPAAVRSQQPAGREAGPAQTVRPAGSRPVSLRPGDVVKLHVWREPEMSRDYEVDGRGRVAFPKLGEVEVAGLSPDSLKQLLEARFGQFLRDASVEVSLRRRISVLGAVRTPGVFQVDPYVTVAEAVALAGGTTPEARTDYVRLRRGNRTLDTRIAVSTPIADSPLESGDQLYVPDRGWATRNVGLISAAVSAAGALVFAFRR